MKKILGAFVFGVVSSLAVVHAHASSSDAAFFEEVSALSLSPLPIPSKSVDETQIAKDIHAYFGFYGELEVLDGFGADQMAQMAAQALQSGSYNGIIFGETHDTEDEQNSAKKIIQSILSAGVPIGAFLSEKIQYQIVSGGGQTHSFGMPLQRALKLRPCFMISQAKPSVNTSIFAYTSILTQANVPILFFANQFQPEADMQKGLEAAGAHYLMTYTGCAHAAKKIKDYILYTLKDTFGPWGTSQDMETVEDVFRKKNKNPIIIEMMAESFVFDYIETKMLNKLTAEGDANQVLQNLRAYEAALSQEAQGFRPKSEITFVQVPEEPNLYVGITPTEKRPLRVMAAVQVLSRTDLVTWLGQDSISMVESQPNSSCDNQHHCSTVYQVIVHKKGSSDTFPAQIPEGNL